MRDYSMNKVEVIKQKIQSLNDELEKLETRLESEEEKQEMRDLFRFSLASAVKLREISELAALQILEDCELGNKEEIEEAALNIVGQSVA
jgi:hypothetical protein